MRPQSDRRRTGGRACKLLLAALAAAALPQARAYRSMVLQIEIEPDADGPAAGDVADTLAAAVSDGMSGQYAASIERAAVTKSTGAGVDVASADDVDVAVSTPRRASPP
jgi:hypothetical protein